MADHENSLSTASGEASTSTSTLSHFYNKNPVQEPGEDQLHQHPVKKKRNQPGMPDPEAEVVALSPEALLATNRFVCEVCGKGFQRDQNLQLHRRGHNLPWKLRQRGPQETVKKRVYVCPERNCVHHDPHRALGDLTGIKKHFCRKHGEKKWKCERCSKKYAVHSDWKAHLKTCGTRQYNCDCGTIFSRRDSFVTHRAFCDALAQESAKVQSLSGGSTGSPPVTASSIVLSPVLPINQNAVALLRARMHFENAEMQESTVGVTNSLRSAGFTTSSTGDCKSSDKGQDNDGEIGFCGSMFAPLSGILPSVSQSQTSFPCQITSVPNLDQHSTYSFEPPPALSLSPMCQFSPNAEQGHYFSPLLQPTMSATALLQKAAQMGAAASGSSLLCGLGSTTHQHEQDKGVKTENGAAVADELELGLPSGGAHFGVSSEMMNDPAALFGSKPMTLDLLGLGIGPVNPSRSAFPVYLTSIGIPLDVAVTTFDGAKDSEVKDCWDGQPAE